MSSTLDDTAAPVTGLLRRLLRPRQRPPHTPVPVPAPPGLTAEQHRYFDEHGYVILRGFFSRPEVDALNDRLEAMWASPPPDLTTVIDTYIGAPNYRRLYFRDADPAVRAHPYKVCDLHFADPVVQNLCADPRLLACLADVLGVAPVVIHTILMEFGSQQPPHFDTFYMPSPSDNLMAAAWIALEAVSETNGPLIFYPGSHRIPPFRFSTGGLHAINAEFPNAQAHMERIVRDHDLKPALFLAEPGDVLLWHAQLLHGGSPIERPEQTRRSLVTHYWTTQDVPAPDLIDLGGGRLMQRKPVPVIADPEDVDAFLAGLATPEQDRAAAPPDFDPRAYLVRHGDVFAAKMDPFTHYRLFGQAEGRDW